ncbi:MAG TPA: nucleotidyltransferase family protein [Cryptosporangiaceae bacterium]|nr:nucleotidyltransferase family protein [Cryptosporangiaceae bacterium]
MRVAGIVLAAGAGVRFGGPKALASLAGQRLVDRSVRLLREGRCAPVYVVAGAAPLVVPGALVVDNPDWETGVGSSLGAGLRAASRVLGARKPSAVVVVPVDTPWLGAEAVRRVVAAHQAGASVAMATYGGEWGHPVLLAAEHWEKAIAGAAGDVGICAFLTAHSELVTEVPCDDTGRPDTVTTPDDLR